MPDTPHARLLSLIDRVFRLVAVCLLLSPALAGCAGRPGPEAFETVAAPATGAHVVTVYVATNRALDPATGDFGNDRSDALSYVRYAISIPPDHKPGSIEWPGRTVDPRHNFSVVERQSLDGLAFRQELAHAPKVGLFVHGFNTNYQEGVYRLAQLAADSDTGQTPVLFSWPSRGSLTAYVADKDSVTASRDQLAGLIKELAGLSAQRKTLVVGHSMGCWLTAEALRQLGLSGNHATLNRLEVVLAAPDIDVDVFRTQFEAIGPLDPPMTILVSADDVALSASSFLSDDRARVGQIDVNDPEIAAVLARAHVQVIDISDIEAPDAANHDRLAVFATYFKQLSADNRAGTNGLRQAGAFVFNAAGATLSSPFRLVGQVVGGQ